MEADELQRRRKQGLPDETFSFLVYVPVLVQTGCMGVLLAFEANDPDHQFDFSIGLFSGKVKMNPVDFPEKTAVLAKDQPEYLPLPVCVDGNSTISCWEMTDEELAVIVKTKRVWLLQMNFGRLLQPQMVSAHSPFPVLPG